MEVKINKEIRNYTESMFFRAVYPAVPFFRPCLRHTSMPRKQGKIKKTPCGYPFMPKMQGE